MTERPSGAVENRVLPEDFAPIVGIANVRPAVEQDDIDGLRPSIVVEPATELEVASVLKAANQRSLAIILKGGGSKLGWGNRPQRADIVLSMRRLNRIIEHEWADMTVSVEAGCTVADLQRQLARHGQRLAIDTLFEETATIGGILAANDSGSLRLRYGPLRDLIIGITIVLPDGTIARSGGRVVKNVAGYDLPKLITGSLGTLAAITSANFRLHPLPKHTQCLSHSYANTREANDALLRVLDSSLVTSGVQIRGEGSGFHLDAKFETNVAGIDAQVEKFNALLDASTTSLDDVWKSRETLFGGSSALVAKCSCLRSELALLIETAQTVADSHAAKLSIVCQATGVSYLRVEADDLSLLTIARMLREYLESNGGSLVVLQSVPGVKKEFDAWGITGSALPLMQRIKQRFDPKGILNPGRFYGAI